jgi:phage N-6-adenine-methyltransferase
VQTVDNGRVRVDSRECDPQGSSQLLALSSKGKTKIKSEAHAGHPELSKESIEYETPADFFDVLNREFGFTLDVCSTAANAKCRRFFTVRENGLAQTWVDEDGAPATCWMNPPYGDQDLTRWMAKAVAEASMGATVVCLVPARTHTSWFHTLCSKGEVRFLRGRLRYVGTAGEAPFAQLVVIFRERLRGPCGMRLWEWRPRTKQRMLALS